MNLNHSVEDEMDKENLEKKFAELLGLNENESVFAFNKFKEKIVDSIFVGDALKIKGLGVFQIKEQLSEEINKTKNRKKHYCSLRQVKFQMNHHLFFNFRYSTKIYRYC